MGTFSVSVHQSNRSHCMQQTETEIDRLKTIVDQIIENARSDIHTEIDLLLGEAEH